MATVTKPIALDESFNTTEVTPRNIADVLAEGLSHITGRTASEVEYDNTESGLTADNVQDALDEIVDDIPTVPSVDIQTAVDEFETYNGGILSSLKVSLTPNQDLHGYDSPWVGGAGKNKYNNQVGSLTTNGVTFTPKSDGSVIANGTATANAYYNMTNVVFAADTYIANGCSSGGSANSYELDVYNNTTSSVIGADRGNGVQFTVNGTDAYRLYIRIASGYTANNLVFYPMVRLATETDPTFAPYSNICPISGHTEVDVDVSDGEATQEQVTVNLGGTYYSGTLDIVTGVFTPDTAMASASDFVFTAGKSDGDLAKVEYTPSNFKNSIEKLKCNMMPYVEQSASWTETEPCYTIANNTKLRVYFDGDTLADFQSDFADLQIIYELATPTPIQLSPTMVKALVGENHLSAPLEGQEITGSKFRELFTWDEVESYVNAHSGGGSGMNYSTEEQVVGTWIDGKPLYEKTFTTTLDNVSSATPVNMADVSGLRIDEIANVSGRVNYYNGSDWFNVNLGTYFGTYIYPNGYLQFFQTITAQTTDRSYKVSVTLQYTKTTD